MTTDRDTTRIVRSWLRSEEHESADRVLDAVLDRLDTTPQRRARPWPVRRFPEMNSAMKLGLAAAAVAVAALLGYTYFGGSNVGGPAPSATEAARPAATPPPDLNEQEGRLEPGRYTVTVADHRITLAVPAGWTKNVVDSAVWTASSEARASFAQLTELNVDPCQPDLGQVEPAIGPGVDDLAAALVELPGVEATSTDVTLAGVGGIRVDVTVPAAFGDCIADGGEAMLNSVAPLEPGLHSFWILDVDGARVVIHAVERTNASDREAAELRQIVESVEID